MEIQSVELGQKFAARPPPLDFLRAEASKYRRELIKLARIDMPTFFSFVMRDETTGGMMEVSATQRLWHRLADKYDRLVMWSHMEAGKTLQMSVARTLWELGRNPGLRFAIVSATATQAAKIAGLIGNYVVNSPELREVFPDLVPDPNGPWNTQQLTVKRPGVMAKDPSVQVVGIGSNIQGSRLNRVILDDVLTWDNTHSQHMRDGCWDWYHKTIPGRVSPVDGRILGIGNVWHNQDLLHRLADNPLWHGFKFPIQNPDGSSTCPQRWSLERIAKRRLELGPIESQIQLDCVCVDDSASRFRRDWIDKCLGRGNGKVPPYAIREVPYGCSVYCGVDLAVGLDAKNDLTVLFVLLIHPNGDREVLWVESGRWKVTDIMAKVVEFSRRFHPIFVVETVAAQDWLRQILQETTAIPIVPYNTTAAKKWDATFGLETMGAEMAAAKWIIPNQGGQCSPDIQAWIGEMLVYNSRDHTGDRLMAAFFAKEGERLSQGDRPPEVGEVRLKLGNW